MTWPQFTAEWSMSYPGLGFHLEIHRGKKFWKGVSFWLQVGPLILEVTWKTGD